jgi:hypothetical protein
VIEFGEHRRCGIASTQRKRLDSDQSSTERAPREAVSGHSSDRGQDAGRTVGVTDTGERLFEAISDVKGLRGHRVSSLARDRVTTGGTVICRAETKINRFGCRFTRSTGFDLPEHAPRVQRSGRPLGSVRGISYCSATGWIVSSVAIRFRAESGVCWDHLLRRRLALGVRRVLFFGGEGGCADLVDEAP